MTIAKKLSNPYSAATGVVKVAAVQMASSPQVASNLIEAERLIALAVKQGAKVVVLPEYFCIMGIKDIDKVTVREKIGEDFIKTVKGVGYKFIGEGE